MGASGSNSCRSSALSPRSASSRSSCSSSNDEDDDDDDEDDGSGSEGDKRGRGDAGHRRASGGGGLHPRNGASGRKGMHENNPRDPSFPGRRYLASKVSALRGNGTGAMQVARPGRKRAGGARTGSETVDESVHAIGRAMHRGDDEGRLPSRRVKIPKKDCEDAAGIDVENDDGDDDDDDDGGNEDAYDDDDDGAEEDEDGDDDGCEAAESDGGGTTGETSSSGGVGGGSFSPNASGGGRRRSQRNIQQQQQNGHRASSSAGSDIGSNASHRPQGHQRDASPPHHHRAQASGGRAYVRLSKCWLCTFSNSRMAKGIAEFASVNAGVMDPTVMADQIKREVLREVSFPPFFLFHPMPLHVAGDLISCRGYIAHSIRTPLG